MEKIQKRIKKLFIIFLFIIFSLGCAVTTSVKQNLNPELIKVSKNIFIQERSKNIRSYHIKRFSPSVYLKIGTIIYNTVGVQRVEVLPYEIKIFKSPLFNWKLIDKTIIILINSWN